SDTGQDLEHAHIQGLGYLLALGPGASPEAIHSLDKAVDPIYDLRLPGRGPWWLPAPQIVTERGWPVGEPGSILSKRALFLPLLGLGTYSTIYSV
ncbi:hypothetical protein CRG98_014164, partial [Punica granatum]